MIYQTASLLSGLLLIAASTAPLCSQDFRTVGSFTPNYVEAGGYNHVDLNANGTEDLVILSFNGLSTLLDPTLTMTTATLNQELVTTTLGFGFFGSIFFDDFNNDGNLDIGVEFQGIFSNAAFVYLPGNGTGAFGSHVNISVATDKSTAVAVGDFDGDGQQDVAAWDFPFAGTPSMTILKQNNGAYSAIHTLTGSGFPGGLSAGDFNADGFDDICWFESGTLTIVLGTNGSFAAPLTLPASANLNDAFVSDLDRDGRDDLIAQSAGPNGWEVDVFWGEPANVFTTPQNVVNVPAPTRSDYIGPFDVDSDGNDELLAVIRSASGYQLIRHDGARTFSPTPYQTTMGGGMIDLDQDGDLDMVTLTSLSGPYFLEENLTRYGAACTGAAGLPGLEIGAPIPGTTITATLQNGAPTSLAQIFISLGSNIGPCGPQLDFSQLLFPLSNTTFLWSATDATGTLSHSFAIPSNAPDGPFFLQGVVIDPQGAFTVGGFALAASGGRALRVY